MKNTKKLFSAVIAATIALCASAQISAMNERKQVIPYLDLSIISESRRVNPKLNTKKRQLLENRIIFMENEIQTLQQTRQRRDIARIPALRNILNRNLAMYYGNYSYTENEIRDTDKLMFQ